MPRLAERAGSTRWPARLARTVRASAVLPRKVLPRTVLPAGLTGLSGLACALCCVIPVLAGAGILSGAGWAAIGAWMPGVAVALAGLAGLAWWWARRRRHSRGCPGGPSCACGT